MWKMAWELCGVTESICSGGGHAISRRSRPRALEFSPLSLVCTWPDWALRYRWRPESPGRYLLLTDHPNTPQSEFGLAAVSSEEGRRTATFRSAPCRVAPAMVNTQVRLNCWRRPPRGQSDAANPTHGTLITRPPTDQCLLLWTRRSTSLRVWTRL